jgi:3-hydroxybutyrate dehydrogenase
MASGTIQLSYDHQSYDHQIDVVNYRYVLTPLVEAQIPDQMKANKMDRETVVREVMLEKQPTKEFVTVEQVAAAAVFLCSDAAAQVNGTHISIDGGWTAQ